MEYNNLISYKEKGIGFIVLSRPNVLNALSFDMIEGLYDILQKWENDDEVTLICLEGQGEKAFCSGGDVRNLYDRKGKDLYDYAYKFFKTEYSLNMAIFTYKKPILSFLNGYVMGGGVGISVGTSHRIVTETSKWAMPEMNIGLYPDVGGSYFLPKMPGYTGRYLALTSNIVKAEDALFVEAADYYMESGQWESLKKALLDKSWDLVLAKEQLEDLLSDYVVDDIEMKSLKSQSQMAKVSEKIDKHFAYDSLEEIIESLESDAKEGDEWAEKTMQTMLKKSPTSLKVTLQQLINGQNAKMKDCFVIL